MPARFGTGQAPRLGGNMSRAEFRQRLAVILGDNRLIWMPNPADTTTGKTEETSGGRVVTYDGSVAGRHSRLGSGYAQSFDGSSQYATIPDAADLSFGNGTVDQPFSIVALVNTTDTAAGREILTKWNGAAAAREWDIGITAGDTLLTRIFDEGVGASQCTSNATIIQGAWTLFGTAYDGRGGATAGDGLSIYQNGAVLVSTATNNASYVAMESLTAEVDIGAVNLHSISYFPGSIALIALAQKRLSAADHAAIAVQCRRYYRQALP